MTHFLPIQKRVKQPKCGKKHFVGFLFWKEAFVIDSMITGDWTGWPWWKLVPDSRQTWNMIQNRPRFCRCNSCQQESMESVDTWYVFSSFIAVIYDLFWFIVNPFLFDIGINTEFRAHPLISIFWVSFWYVHLRTRKG